MAANTFGEIIEVNKFNPYHDSLGRFATAGGYSTFTYAPGKSKAHDLAIARQKERMAKIMPSEAQAKTLRGIENRTRNLKKEQFRVVDREGNIVMQKQGDKNSVSYSVGEARDNFSGNITIHNHPDGGTFSTADLSDIGYGATEIRAASPEGTYILRNMRHGARYNAAKEKTWVDMREDLDAATEGFKTHREIKKEIRKPFDAQVERIAENWVSRKNAGASKEELDKIYSEYTAMAESFRPQIEAATRKAYVDQHHHWLKQNAGKYGLEYEFVPIQTKTRKSYMEFELTETIKKGAGDDVVLDAKTHQDIEEITDGIISDMIADFPSVQKSDPEFSVFKTDDDKRLIFGWASISITVDGEQLEDRQKDMIDPEDLEEAAYEYVLNFRDTGEEHIQSMRKKGKLVESCVFTAEKQKAIGIPEGTLPIGWWIGFKIEDDDAWARVKNGTYKMFSIEGKANRIPVEKSVETVERVAKTFDEILKFNPYHDSRGRFASANSYSSFTIRTKDPKKQHMADMAISREKERAAAASANPTNDPDTIGGVKRGRPMTHEQADEGRGNPHYNDLDTTMQKARDAERKWYDAMQRKVPEEELKALETEKNQALDKYNQAYKDQNQYRINCQSCVVAYEARRRGYDVEAVGRTKKNQNQEDLARDCAAAWVDPATGNAPKVLVNDPKIRTAKQTQKWLEQNIEEGGRYHFSHGWKGTNGRNGHIVTIEKDSSGALRIFDPQNGKTYTGSDATDYLGRTKATYSTQKYNPRKASGWESIPQGRLRLLRVDNLQLKEAVANDVLRGS